MPTPDLRDHRILVHKILARAHSVLERVEKGTLPPMSKLLSEATETVCDRHAGSVSPHHVAWLEAEAATLVITASGWRPVGLTDPTLPQQLTRLDQQTRATRLHLLAIAAHATNPNRPDASRRPRIPGQRTYTALSTGPCSCACNAGGSCGGCGHAGCSGRR